MSADQIEFAVASECACVFVDPLFHMHSNDPEAYRVGAKYDHMWSHMWCSPGHEPQLHAIARKIGMRLEWFQDKQGFPHYDLVPPRRAAALKHGVAQRSLADWLRERRAAGATVEVELPEKPSPPAGPSRRVTPRNVGPLRPGEVFVFGSSKPLAPGASVLEPILQASALRGMGEGPCGRCYGIVVRDENLRPLPLATIAQEIEEFLGYAHANRRLIFWVPEVACSLGQYSPQEIAPLFFKWEIPPNVALPERFWALEPTDEAPAAGDRSS